MEHIPLEDEISKTDEAYISYPIETSRSASSSLYLKFVYTRFSFSSGRPVNWVYKFQVNYNNNEIEAADEHSYMHTCWSMLLSTFISKLLCWLQSSLNKISFRMALFKFRLEICKNSRWLALVTWPKRERARTN